MKIRTALYRLYDDAGELLYVGIGAQPKSRISEHRKKPWGSEIHSTTTEWHESRDAALAAEAAAIAAERPAYNIVASQVRKGGTDWYCAPDVEPLYGVAEMAHILRLTRQRVRQLTQRPDFPEPAQRFIMGDAWFLADFTAWAKATGRTLHKR